MAGITRFDIGSLHVQYLDIPLESKKLLSKHYIQLVENIGKRIGH